MQKQEGHSAVDEIWLKMAFVVFSLKLLNLVAVASDDTHESSCQGNLAFKMLKSIIATHIIYNSSENYLHIVNQQLQEVMNHHHVHRIS